MDGSTYICHSTPIATQGAFNGGSHKFNHYEYLTGKAAWAEYASNAKRYSTMLKFGLNEGFVWPDSWPVKLDPPFPHPNHMQRQDMPISFAPFSLAQ